MNKTLAITAIVLVAVVMGMSAVAPMIPEADAHGDGEIKKHKMCANKHFMENAPQEVIDRLCNHGG